MIYRSDQPKKTFAKGYLFLDGVERIVEMISRIYISHSRKDESLAQALSRSLWRVGLESYVALYSLSTAISRSERSAFGLRNSECMLPLLTSHGW
ncbi:MAG: toll/interleukin-1 receptor domain-containing protein [Methanothrix sp.]|nr:toll/interleukin-1 receptor domain-containing protein [Methanothrix sp.]